jgi:hypothetical protein
LADPPPLTAFSSRFPQAPTLLFNGMSAPLTSYRIMGVICYQGGTVSILAFSPHRRLAQKMGS